VVEEKKKKKEEGKKREREGKIFPDSRCASEKKLCLCHRRPPFDKKRKKQIALYLCVHPSPTKKTIQACEATV
jgi:hypothetical protein